MRNTGHLPRVAIPTFSGKVCPYARLGPDISASRPCGRAVGIFRARWPCCHHRQAASADLPCPAPCQRVLGGVSAWSTATAIGSGKKFGPSPPQFFRRQLVYDGRCRNFFSLISGLARGKPVAIFLKKIWNRNGGHSFSPRADVRSGTPQPLRHPASGVRSLPSPRKLLRAAMKRAGTGLSGGRLPSCTHGSGR